MRRFQDSLLIGVFVALALTALSVLAGGGPGVSGPMHNVGSTAITGGTSNRLLRNNAGVLANSLLSDDGTNVTLTSGQFLTETGSSTAPAYSFTGDANTGMFWSGAQGQLQFTSDGATQARLSGGVLDLATNAIRFGSAFGTSDVVVNRAAANRLALATGDSIEAESYRDITLNAVCATPSADHVNYCTHDGSNHTGTATNDCARVAVLDDGTEVLIQVLRTDAPC